MVGVIPVDPGQRSADEPATQEVDFRDFFEREYERLGRAAFLLCGDAGEAEELAQEAFVRVYEHWDRVREMGSPVGYLYRVALNLQRSRLRRLGAWARRRPVAEPAGPGDPAAWVETRDEIARGLAALPVGQRAALLLVEWLGMSDEEAGRVLGIAPTSVRVRISRARTALRGLSGDDDG